MPYLGLTSFLLYVTDGGITPHLVSMPYLGLTSFLHKMIAYKEMKTLCVNALSRAHVISTPTSKIA